MDGERVVPSTFSACFICAEEHLALRLLFTKSPGRLGAQFWHEFCVPTLTSNVSLINEVTEY